MCAVQVIQQLENHLTGPKIQVAGWLVGKQYAWCAHQRTGEHNTLLLPTRQLSGAVCRPRAQSDFIQPRQCVRGGFVPVSTANQQRHHHVFQRREFRQQVVNLPNKPNFPIAKVRLLGLCETRYLSTSVVYRTRGRPVQTAQHMQQGALAGPALSNQGQHFATLYIQVKPGKYNQFASPGLVYAG